MLRALSHLPDTCARSTYPKGVKIRRAFLIILLLNVLYGMLYIIIGTIIFTIIITIITMNDMMMHLNFQNFDFVV